MSVDRRKETSWPSRGVQDENRPANSPSGPPSSPFVEDVSLPPSKFLGSPDVRSLPSVEPHGNTARPLTEDALRENNLARANGFDESNIDPFIRGSREQDMNSINDGVTGFPGMDDTCFSAFSAVPNADMTRFARLGQSPTKGTATTPSRWQGEDADTPRPAKHNSPSRRTPNTAKSSQKPKLPYEEDTTNLLVDFTADMDGTHASNFSPQRPRRQSPLKSAPHHELSCYAAKRRTPSPVKMPLPPNTPTEARHLANLLDFDLTPAPTPRSIPSITARELESMKSNFLSQISSLTATLSGREAEVKALSNAVNDAERRVGEALEEIRNEKNARESLQEEKDGYESRQQEMQKVLKDVKEEIMASDREKDALLQRTQEAEHQRELAEARAVEAEGKVEGLKARSPAAGTGTSESGGNANAEVEAAVTKVAKELHGLYKSKHEAKVTALKKSYSDRWEKKVKDLQSKVDELSRENEDLRIGRDATMSGVVPGTLSTKDATLPDSKAAQEEDRKATAEFKQRLESAQLELHQTQKDLTSARGDNEALRSQLVASRQEIEDLIAATEELMQLSQSTTASSSLAHDELQPIASGTTSQDIKSSLSRSFSSSSGLKVPGFSGGTSVESRIGRGTVAYGGSYSRERSGSGLGIRSGIMSNIEKMGRVRAAE